MSKRLIGFFLFLLLSGMCRAQLQSPEQFLGYKIGTKYTPHWRIVEYFRHVAASMPAMVQLQAYGQTNEGRPLMVSFVSSAANMAKLEQIRTNNLRLAALENGAGATAEAPAIVWLSYNVHGNETSSSEASMLTLFALVDPANTRTKQWLQNTVVVLDPCLNPDGRDRYVNWFNSMAGRQFNPAPEAREHREPWPGGRSNHYNFDLNRDWAWQTQLESRQRLALYNKWLPQVHVDFHEQGINEPYYFAPAAQPFHEVITPWQRSFQETIGRNHSRYFDEKGWLYFTRERFDLLYPSYGDTYPTYAGAIGMTYEQGGIGAGLGILTDDGDTLTLVDRAEHHFTTGLSTVEVAAQNAGKLVTEFQKFFRNAATNGIGEYKSYVIKYDPRDAERIAALKSLLDKNEIRYGTASGSNLRGFNFDNSREEAFSIAPSDLVISTVQPRGTLVNVLFEPRTTVVDSNTYDITAWSMPYAYGVKAFATRNAIAVSAPTVNAQAVRNTGADPYAYVIRWTGINGVKLAGKLMQRGVRLRYSESPFEVGGQSFDRGSIVVMKTSNQYVPNLWNMVRSLADSAGVQLTPVTTGFVDKGFDFGSAKMLPMKNRKVALITGEGVSSLGAGEIWHFFDQVLEYPLTLINQGDLGRIRWSDYDVVIMPEGVYRFLNDKPAAEQLRNWIAAGGNLVAMEGAVQQLSRLEWTIKAKQEDTASDRNPYAALQVFENRERDFIQNITPGSIHRVELDNTHPLAFGYPGYYYTLKQDEHLYEFVKGDGWNVGVLKKGGRVAGFVGNKLARKLQDGMLFGTQEIGRGSVNYLADNLLFRNFWENGKLMFCNAVFLVGQ